MKAGRKRKANAPRTPSGQITRSFDYQRQLADETISFVVKQRQHIHGLSAAHARREEAGTVIGRLYLEGPEYGLHRDQHEALCYFAEQRARWRLLCGLAPESPASPGFTMVSSGGIPEASKPEDPEQTAAAGRAYNAALNQLRGDHLRIVLDVAGRDMPLPHPRELSIGLLREAANALGRHYRMMAVERLAQPSSASAAAAVAVVDPRGTSMNG